MVNGREKRSQRAEKDGDGHLAGREEGMKIWILERL